MDKNLICPQCGSDQYVINNAGGSTTTFLMCKSCGKKGTKEAWQKQKNIMKNNGDSFEVKSFNLKNIKKIALEVTPIIKKDETVKITKEYCPHCNKEILEKSIFSEASNDGYYIFHRDCKGPIEFISNKESEKAANNIFRKKAQSVANSNELASSKPFEENDPEIGFKRKKYIDKRTNMNSDGSEALQDKRYNPENMKADSSGDIKKMAFNLKKLKANKETHCNCLSKHAHVKHEDMCEDCKIESKKLANKPFNMMKIAREFRYTEDQLARIDMKKNMVSPEGRQDLKSKDSKGKGNGTGDKYIGVEENRRFDTIDRKDARTPDPKQLISGYERWYNNEVDQYYDGWLDDHIENAGGKVVGSNTEKMMNLNDNERYHVPVFPQEASYEKLLESRHNFDDDYERKVAFNLSKLKLAKKKI